eukprot:gene22477-29599_t
MLESAVLRRYPVGLKLRIKTWDQGTVIDTLLSIGRLGLSFNRADVKYSGKYEFKFKIEISSPAHICSNRADVKYNGKADVMYRSNSITLGLSVSDSDGGTPSLALIQRTCEQAGGVMVEDVNTVSSTLSLMVSGTSGQHCEFCYSFRTCDQAGGVMVADVNTVTSTLSLMASGTSGQHCKFCYSFVRASSKEVESNGYKGGALERRGANQHLGPSCIWCQARVRQQLGLGRGRAAFGAKQHLGSSRGQAAFGAKLHLVPSKGQAALGARQGSGSIGGQAAFRVKQGPGSIWGQAAFGAKQGPGSIGG